MADNNYQSINAAPVQYNYADSEMQPQHVPMYDPNQMQ